MARMVHKVSKPWVILLWPHPFNMYTVAFSKYASWFLSSASCEWTDLNVCVCWKVQYLGTRGQYFGPAPGPGLWRAVSNHGKLFFYACKAVLFLFIFILVFFLDSCLQSVSLCHFVSVLSHPTVPTSLPVRRRWELWPIAGKVSDPGGSSCG